jgi:hypothetical protein
MIDEDRTMPLDSTTLSEPAVIKGHVLDWQGEPMCGVTIDVFHSTETEAHLIGQALSSEEEGVCTGYYTITIPNRFISPEEE